MRNHVGALVGTDNPGNLVLDLLTGSLAPTTYNTYGTGMRRFTVFYNEEGIIPLEATAADMLRFTTWLARAGTVAVNILQPYFSAINKFFRNHFNKEPMALGPLLTDGRRGLAMQQQPITEPEIRVPIPTPIVQHMLLFAHRHYYRALILLPDNFVYIKTFRAILSVCINYCYFAARKPTYFATCTTSRSTRLAVTYFYSYEKQKEINIEPRPTNRSYNSRLLQYRY
jgi:hypothetical protein